MDVVKSERPPNSQLHTYWLSIFTKIEEEGFDPDVGFYSRLKVEYDDRKGEFTRVLSTKGSKFMPNAYASHVLTTIDLLIPGTAGGSSQSAEIQIP
jgi:hypothetical protein